jgi:hypothetical protein
MEIEIKIEELRKKKIFVATPMYGGMCSGMYTKSTADLATIATQYGMDVRFFYLFNESLITRARNYLVDEFLRSPYTHLMFIDSDIHFNPNDVLTLAALDKEIIGAPYAKKVIAWEKVRNAVDAGLADDDPTKLEEFTGDFVFNPIGGTTEIKVSEPVEVLEIGTGFMLIAREVLEKFRDAYPQFAYKPDHNRSENFDGSRYIHAFFDTVIDSEAFAGAGSGGSDRYLSEDYMFCQFTRKIGISTWLCPWMKLGHVGSYVFNGTLPALGNLDFAAHGNDMESRPHNVTEEEENEAEKASGKTLNRSEKRKAARKSRKDKK